MIYLHIGKAKTGTTTIQSGLQSNYQNLLSEGYLYPQVGLLDHGHHNLYFELARDERFDPTLGTADQLVKNIQEYKKSNPAGNVIISSESLIGLLTSKLWRTTGKSQLSSVIDRLQAIDKIKIIFILRRQDRYYQSFWSMNVRDLNTTLDVDEYVLKMLQNPLRMDENYDSVIDLLAKTEGIDQVQLIGFDRLKEGGNIFHNFLELCDIPKDKLSLYETPINANTSPSLFALEMIREFSKMYEKNNMHENRKVELVHCIKTISIRNKWNKIGPQKNRYLKKETYQKLIEEFQEGNEVIISKFPKLKSELDFDQNYSKEAEIELKELPLKDYLELVAFSYVRGVKVTNRQHQNLKKPNSRD